MLPFLDTNRQLLKIKLTEASSGLMQRLMSTDIRVLSKQNKALYSLFLSPKGKLIFDFFLIVYGKYLLLDCHKIDTEALIEHIAKFDIHKETKLTNLTDRFRVYIHKEPEVNFPDVLLTYVDPRLDALGYRSIIKGDSEFPASNEKYEYTRISNTVPDLKKESDYEMHFPFELKLDTFNAISFEKGCYIGQEITVLIKRKNKTPKISTLINDRDIFHVGDTVSDKNGEKVGVITSKSGKIGICRFDKNIRYEEQLFAKPGNIIRHLNHS